MNKELQNIRRVRATLKTLLDHTQSPEEAHEANHELQQHLGEDPQLVLFVLWGLLRAREKEIRMEEYHE
jgi:hypothetical protein